MLSAPPVPRRGATYVGLLTLLAIALLIPPFGQAASPGAPALPRSSVPLPAVQVVAGSPGVAPTVPILNATTSIGTTDSATGNNVGVNFTLRLTTMTLGPSDNMNVTIRDILTAGLSGFNTTAVGVWASYTGSSTVLHPEAVLPNGTVIVDTSNTLPNTGSLVFRVEHASGFWWTFTTVGGQPIGSGAPAWQNGTYMLNVSVAQGVVTGLGGNVLFGPSVEIRESGATLPYPSSAFAGAFTPVMMVNSSGNPYAPNNGIYAGARQGPTLSVPLAGQNQVPLGLVGPDMALIDPPGAANPTTTNGTAIWGATPPPPNTPHTWLGAYSADRAVTNVTGISVTLTVPSFVPALGQVVVQEAELPVNGTLEVAVGFADVNVTIFSLHITGVYPFYTVFDSSGGSGASGFANSQLTPGSLDTMSFQQISGYWWQAQLNGAPLSTWFGGATNGSVLLNHSIAWGTNNRSAWGVSLASGAGSFGVNIPLIYFSQPILAFFGNQTTFYTTSSLLVQKGGSWIVPSTGLAWQWEPQWCPSGQPASLCPDILIGSHQVGGVPAGMVITENYTTPYQHALTNGTIVWVATTVAATAAPSVLSSGAVSTLNLSALSGSTPLTTATIVGSDPMSGTFGVFSAMGNPGNYTGSYTAPTVTSNTWTNLTLTVSESGFAAGLTKVPVLLRPALTVQDNIAGYAGTTATVLPSTPLTVNVWTNISGVGVAGPTPILAINNSDATQASATMVSPGYFQVPVSVVAAPTKSSASLTIAVVAGTYSGFNNAQGTALTLLIQLPTLSVAAVTVTPSSGTPSAVTAGATIEFATTVTGQGGAPVAGAAVTLSFTPAGMTASGATTTAAGVAYFNVTAPSTLSAAVTYTVQAAASASGYRSSSSPSASFTVEPPSNPGPGPGTNGTGSPSLLANPLFLVAIVVAIVAVVAVVALLMMRKKKASATPPQAWSGPAPEEGTAPAPPGGPGGMPPETG